MKRWLLLVPLALLAACASYPDRVIGPTSPPDAAATAVPRPPLSARPAHAPHAPQGAMRIGRHDRQRDGNAAPPSACQAGAS